MECIQALGEREFDLITAMNVLGYVPVTDGDAFYVAAARALKPGGHLLMA